MRLRDRLLNHAPTDTERRRLQAEIREGALARRGTLRKPMFTRVTPADLEALFRAYDARFFAGTIAQALAGPRGGPLTFDVSRRMIRSGGMTRRDRTQVGQRIEQRYSIGVSATLLGGTFRGEERTVTVCGVPCTDRLAALLRIFEHELIHLVEFLVWGDSNCRAGRFAGIVRTFFGHTEATHALVTPRERVRAELGIGVGDRVQFRAGRTVHIGVVNRITRRATILVPSATGVPYSDGERYEKYYVPIERLERLD